MAAVVADAMPDTGTITRTGGGTVNATTGNYEAAAATTIYSGAMHIRPPDSNEVDVLFGDREFSTQRYVGTIPADAAVPQHDDVLVLTSASASGLEGVPMRVTFVLSGSYHLGYKLALEAVE